MNPFEYAHDLITKEVYDGEIPQRKDYKKFLINRTLSYYQDIIHIINEVNIFPDISNQLHYDFIHTLIPKKKRPKKYWVKAKKYENLELVKEYFNYSNQKAISALSVLSDKDIDTIKKLTKKGGL